MKVHMHGSDVDLKETHCPVSPVPASRGASPLVLATKRAPRSVKPWRRSVKLTPRHIETAAHVAAGLRNKEIAHRMGITDGAVKIYIYELFRLTGRDTRVSLSQWWQERFASRPVIIGLCAQGEPRMGVFE
jgi:DNA-binding CsgD family transcriptional regulator